MQNAGNRLDIVVRKRYCHEKQKNVILFCKIKEYGEGIFRNMETLRWIGVTLVSWIGVTLVSWIETFYEHNSETQIFIDDLKQRSRENVKHLL